jgi:hypothetical protein
VVTLFDDSLEFQLVTYQLGIPHPTGYPLYVLLGKLFTLLPVGNVAYRVNLMSAFFGAATNALLYLLILAMINDTPLPITSGAAHISGLLGAMMLAVSQVFWQQATIAEVYALNAFFVSLLLLWLVGPLSTKPDQPVSIAFLAGLSLTHHRTMLLLFPALVLTLYLMYGKDLFRPNILLPALAWGVLPLLLYLYLPLRGHIGSLDGTYQNTWAGFWQQVTGGGYGTFLFDNPFGHERGITFYGQLLADQFYSLIPGFVGLLYLVWRRGKIILLTGLVFVSYLSFNLFYQVSDIAVFFIPIFLLWAVWSGVGVAVFLELIGRFNVKLWRYGLSILLLLLLVGGILQQFQRNRAELKAIYTWQVHDYGLDMLQQPLPTEAEGGSTIIGILGEMTLLRYFQHTEHRRPDIETVAADRESERLAAVDQALGRGKNVYLTRELPGAAARWSLRAIGPLIQVQPQPITAKLTPTTPLSQTVTPQLALRGYDLARPPHTEPGPAPIRLTLFWQTLASLSTDLKVSARLLTTTGEPIAVVDAIPVHFAYPTTAWRPGEIVTDVYDFELPLDTPPGSYTPLIIWYDPAQNAAEVGRVTLGSITVN